MKLKLRRRATGFVLFIVVLVVAAVAVPIIVYLFKPTKPVFIGPPAPRVVADGGEFVPEAQED